jgi:hypothetical protein
MRKLINLSIRDCSGSLGMDNFNEYLKGKPFILYTNNTPMRQLGHLHIKTFNLLQTALMDHDFITQNKQTSNLPSQF